MSALAVVALLLSKQLGGKRRSSIIIPAFGKLLMEAAADGYDVSRSASSDCVHMGIYMCVFVFVLVTTRQKNGGGDSGGQRKGELKSCMCVANGFCFLGGEVVNYWWSSPTIYPSPYSLFICNLVSCLHNSIMGKKWLVTIRFIL